jgi:hypothetical protein
MTRPSGRTASVSIAARHTQAVAHVKDIGTKPDADTDFATLRATLEESHRKAGAGHCKCRA